MLGKMEFLSAAENRESFFRRIGLLFPSLDPRYRMIEKAYNVAKDAFRGINREGGGRYFEHIRGATLIQVDYLRVKDPNLIVSELLHDIVEDVPYWTVDRVRAEFNDIVAFYVQFMTKPTKGEYPDKRERDHAYHSRFELAPREFFLCKNPDRLHNLITLWDCDEAKRKRKIEETRLYYLPYAERHFILYHEMVEAIERLERAPA